MYAALKRCILASVVLRMYNIMCVYKYACYVKVYTYTSYRCDSCDTCTVMSALLAIHFNLHTYLYAYTLLAYDMPLHM